MSLKTCFRCKKEKSLDEFGLNKSRTDGHQNVCKVCRRDHAKNWYEENRSLQVQRNQDYRHRNGVKPRQSNPIAPQFLAEWHPTKNGDLDPASLSSGSNRSIWWLCSEQHDWLSSPAKRSRGALCPKCHKASGRDGKDNRLVTKSPTVAAQWHPTKNYPVKAEDVSDKSAMKAWWMGECEHEWPAVVYARTAGSGCPRCHKLVSDQEQELVDILKSWGLKVITSDRSVIGPQELDIYLPDQGIAIEFNGVYWHSEAYGKTKWYHHNKWRACKDKGIQLIQIWDDDWRRSKSLILNMLSHKLSMHSISPVYARSTQVQAVSKEVAADVLNTNHIQGFVTGSYYLALTHPTQGIVAVLVLRKIPHHPDLLDIVRYATARPVPGGFTKLLKYAERAYHPEAFITFSDNMVSDGGLYVNNGFLPDKALPPDYTYLVGGQRRHKFGYRLARFKKDPTLIWQPGLSERELAVLNNLPRVWDAGKIRWRKVVKQPII